MRTLDQITTAARLNEPLDTDEARLAIAAYDVLISRINVEQSVEQLTEYFQAASTPPIEYLNEENSPYNEEFISWYRAMHGIGDTGS